MHARTLIYLSLLVGLPFQVGCGAIKDFFSGSGSQTVAANCDPTLDPQCAPTDGGASPTVSPAIDGLLCPSAKDFSRIANIANETLACTLDEDCPVGSYCDPTGVCASDCSERDRPCASPLACDCTGRCVPAEAVARRPPARTLKLRALPGTLVVEPTNESSWARSLGVVVEAKDPAVLTGTGEVRERLVRIAVRAGSRLRVHCGVLPAGQMPSLSTCEFNTPMQFRQINGVWTATTSVSVGPGASTPTLAGVQSRELSVLIGSDSAADSPLLVPIVIKTRAAAVSYRPAPALDLVGKTYRGTVTITTPVEKGALRLPDSSSGTVLPVEAVVGGQCGALACLTIVDPLGIISEMATTGRWISWGHRDLGQVVQFAVVSERKFVEEASSKTIRGFERIKLSSQSLISNPNDPEIGLTYLLEPAKVNTCASNEECGAGRQCSRSLCTPKRAPATGVSRGRPSEAGSDTSSWEALRDALLPEVPLGTGFGIGTREWLEPLLCTNTNGVRNGFSSQPLLPLSGDLACLAGPDTPPGTTATQRGMPLFSRGDLPNSNTSVDSLLWYCVREMQDQRRPVPPPNARVPSRTSAAICFEPDLYYDVLASFVTDQGLFWDRAGQSLFLRAVGQWADLNAFLSTQLVEQHRLARVQGGLRLSQVGTPNVQPPLSLEQAVSEIATNWTLLTVLNAPQSSLIGDSLFDLLDADVVWEPDYRIHLGRLTGLKPESEQKVGLPVKLFEDLSTFLKLVELYVEESALKTAADGESEQTWRARSLAAMALRQSILVESIAFKIAQRAVASTEQCSPTVACTSGTCLSLGEESHCVPQWYARYQQAARAYVDIRARIVSKSSNEAAPLGVAKNDIPLFFGDLTGTNSRFFASSDYLVNNWAASAVSSAQGALEAAREAWYRGLSSNAQDLDRANEQARRLDAIKQGYGSQLARVCGLPTETVKTKDVVPLLRKPPEMGGITVDDCFIDRTRNECSADKERAASELIRSTEMAFTDKLRAFANCEQEYVKQPYEILDATGFYANTTDATNVCRHYYKWNPTAGDATVLVYRWGCSFEPPEATVSCGMNSGHVDCFGGDGRCRWSTDCEVCSLPTLQPTPQGGGKGCTRSDKTASTLCRTKKLVPVQCSRSEYDRQLKRALFDFAAYDRITSLCEERLGESRAAITEGPLSQLPLPDGCYRGALGTAMLKIEGARQDVELAYKNWGDLLQQYEIQGRHCLRLQKDKERLDQALRNFQGRMLELRSRRDGAIGEAQFYGEMSAVYTTFTKVRSPGEAALAAPALFANHLANDAEAVARRYSSEMEGERERHEAFLQSLAAEQQVASCFVEVDKMRTQFDTYAAQIPRRMTDASAAILEFVNLKQETARIASDGLNDLDIETQRPQGTYSHHFWLDEKIERYQREFDWAKRLVYLVLQAVEYEFQQSLPLRGPILSSLRPDELESALREMQREIATRAINRRRPEEASIVMSLRDDVLAIQDLPAGSSGDRVLAAASRFRGRLWDSRFALYNQQGQWLGQAVPFSMPVVGQLHNRCAERLWRVSATVQGDGLSDKQPGAPLILLKRNTFGSKWCEGTAPSEGESPIFQIGRVQPSRNLFKDDPGTRLAGEAEAFSSAGIYPWFNVRRADFFKDSYRDGASEELAGRGLYGDYILLFPRELLIGEKRLGLGGSLGEGREIGADELQQERFPLERVEDVLLRFDYLSVDDFARNAVQAANVAP